MAKHHIVQRVTSKPEDVKKARELGRDVFSEMGPEGEDALFEFLKGRLEGWHGKLSRYRDLTETGSYPGARDIADSLSLLRILVAPEDSHRFLAEVNDRGRDLRDLADGFHDIEHFYEHQRPIWDKLRAASYQFRLNQMELERDDAAGSALRRMNAILSAPNPYGLLKEADRSHSHCKRSQPGTAFCAAGSGACNNRRANRRRECGSFGSGWRRIVENKVPHATGKAGEAGFNA